MEDAHSVASSSGASSTTDGTLGFDLPRTGRTTALGQKDLARHAPITWEQYEARTLFPVVGLVNIKMRFTRKSVRHTLQLINKVATGLLIQQYSFGDFADMMAVEYGVEEMVENATQGHLQAQRDNILRQLFRLLRRAENMGVQNIMLECGYVAQDAVYRCAHVYNVGFTVLLGVVHAREMAQFSRLPKDALAVNSPFRNCPFGYRCHPDFPPELRVANPPIVTDEALLTDILAALAESEGDATPEEDRAEATILAQEQEQLPFDFWEAASMHTRGIGGANVSGNGGGPVRLPGGPGRKKGGQRGGGRGGEGGEAPEMLAPQDIYREIMGHGITPEHPPMSAAMQLVCYLWRQGQACGLRHDGKLMYTRVWAGGEPTSAWRPLRRNDRDVTIEQWARWELCPESHWDQFMMLDHTNFGRVIETLRGTETNIWPRYEPDRHYVAWKNGVVQTVWQNPQTGRWGARFLPHSHPELADKCACIYHDAYIDPVWWTTQNSRAIGTPAWDTILETQHFTENSKWYIQAMTGRTLVPLHEVERSHKIMLMVGCAGSGKSSWIEGVQSYFPTDKVAIVPTNVKDEWAVSTMDGCYLWVMSEMKEHVSLHQATLQSLASGERLQANPKGVQPYSTTIRACGIIAGNEMAGNLIDSAGSLTRRFFHIAMDYVPERKDGNLVDMMYEERGAMFVKLLRSYYELVNAMQDKKRRLSRAVEIDEFMSPQLHEMQHRLQISVQPITHLLNAKHWFERPPVHVLKFWKANVEHNGRLRAGAPGNGVRPETHPDFFVEGQLLSSVALPADPRDYMDADGTVYSFMDYAIDDITIKRAWSMYCEETQQKAEAKTYNPYNVRSVAPKCGILVVVHRDDNLGHDQFRDEEDILTGLPGLDDASNSKNTHIVIEEEEEEEEEEEGTQLPSMGGRKRSRTSDMQRDVSHGGGAAAATTAADTASGKKETDEYIGIEKTFTLHGIRFVPSRLDLMRAAFPDM